MVNDSLDTRVVAGGALWTYSPAISIRARSPAKARDRPSCNFERLMRRRDQWKSSLVLDGRASFCTKLSAMVWRPTSIEKGHRHLPVLWDKRSDPSFVPLSMTEQFRFAVVL